MTDVERIAVLRDSHYAETESKLMKDRHIKDMAAEIAMDFGEDIAVFYSKSTHADGHPNFEFMSSALNEYHNRDGKIQSHIGGPANAILAILRDK